VNDPRTYEECGSSEREVVYPGPTPTARSAGCSGTATTCSACSRWASGACEPDPVLEGSEPDARGEMSAAPPGPPPLRPFASACTTTAAGATRAADPHARLRAAFDRSVRFLPRKASTSSARAASAARSRWRRRPSLCARWTSPRDAAALGRRPRAPRPGDAAGLADRRRAAMPREALPRPGGLAARFLPPARASCCRRWRRPRRGTPCGSAARCARCAALDSASTHPLEDPDAKSTLASRRSPQPSPRRRRRPVGAEQDHLEARAAASSPARDRGAAETNELLVVGSDGARRPFELPPERLWW